MRYVFGIPRSGSTLAYNLVRLLTGEPVEHTHSFVERTDAKLPMVCTFRDFRDCAASWWLTKDANWRKEATFTDLLTRMEILKPFVATLERYRREYPPDQVFFARYETWTHWTEEYAIALAQKFDEPFRPQGVVEARSIGRECSLKKMRERNGQPDWKIDGQVNDGRSKWREVVKPEDQQRVTDFFAADLEAWGYEL